METTVTSLAEFEAEAVRFAESLVRAAGTATLITLAGELGAGKTAFTKAVARAFGIEEVVNSPTFVLEKIYDLPDGHAFDRLVHIDAYRLDSGTDLKPLGFDELMADPGNLIMLEWPEKVEGGLPPAAVSIAITAAPEGFRTISYGKKN